MPYIRNHWRSLLLVASALCVIAWTTVLRYRLIYPGPHTQSIFLTSYTPQPVLQRFEGVDFSRGMSEQSSAEAGRHFVTHDHSFEPCFTLHTRQLLAIFNALDDDILARLHHLGAANITRTGDSRQGLRFSYQLGNSVGTVNLRPITASPCRLPASRPPYADVSFKVTCTEHWYPDRAPRKTGRIKAGHLLSAVRLSVGHRP